MRHFFDNVDTNEDSIRNTIEIFLIVFWQESLLRKKKKFAKVSIFYEYIDD